MEHDAEYFDRRGREQREHAANASSQVARDIHNQLADRHADIAWRIREVADAAADAVHARLVSEAAVEHARRTTLITELAKRRSARINAAIAATRV